MFLSPQHPDSLYIFDAFKRSTMYTYKSYKIHQISPDTYYFFPPWDVIQDSEHCCHTYYWFPPCLLGLLLLILESVMYVLKTSYTSHQQ